MTDYGGENDDVSIGDIEGSIECHDGEPKFSRALSFSWS